MDLSWIQQYSLMVLLRHETARVKDLTPRDIPANAFAYHLQGLVAMKLIEKIDRGRYKLTPKGQKLAARLSTATNKVSEELRTVIMLYAKRGDEYLFFRWSRQPYMGEVTLVYDHVSAGQHLDEAVKTALFDKLGDETIPVKFMQSALIQVKTEGEVVSHMHALIYAVDLHEVALPLVSRNGEAFMACTDDSPLMNGVVETIVSAEQAKEPFEATWEYA